MKIYWEIQYIVPMGTKSKYPKIRESLNIFKKTLKIYTVISKQSL